MRTNVLLGVLAIVILTLSASSGWADHEGGYSSERRGDHEACHEMMGLPESPHHHLRHLLRHRKEIGLTDDQVAKLKAIQLDLDRAHIKTEADIRVAERELMALLEDEKTEFSAIESKVKQSESLEAALRLLGFKARRDALGVLTPEQREKAKAAHEKMMQEMAVHYGYSEAERKEHQEGMEHRR